LYFHLIHLEVLSSHKISIKVQDALKSLGNEKEAKIALESLRKEILEDLQKAKLEEKRLNDQVYLCTFFYCHPFQTSILLILFSLMFPSYFFTLYSSGQDASGHK
jgi:hypothetical protein